MLPNISIRIVCEIMFLLSKFACETYNSLIQNFSLDRQMKYNYIVF